MLPLWPLSHLICQDDWTSKIGVLEDPSKAHLVSNDLRAEATLLATCALSVNSISRYAQDVCMAEILHDSPASFQSTTGVCALCWQELDKGTQGVLKKLTLLWLEVTGGVISCKLSCFWGCLKAITVRGLLILLHARHLSASMPVQSPESTAYLPLLARHVLAVFKLLELVVVELFAFLSDSLRHAFNDNFSR